jgi:hypothetical protein
MALVEEIEAGSENFADAIKQENSRVISKLRSLFVDPGFPALPDADAGIAVPTEEFPKDEL